MNACQTQRVNSKKYLQEVEKKIHILFDGKGIQSAIIRMINKQETAFVVGCIAWVSNKSILKAMAKKRGGGMMKKMKSGGPVNQHKRMAMGEQVN